MKISRVWPALVLVCFCLPLFIGLGGTDLGNDEAIYSWAADRILETGDWLVPKQSPHLNDPFLEKPPLKMWIVAAGIKAGLPHDEFGLRFWDAVCGGLAFLYVLAIGRRVNGVVCGTAAVLILFVHEPLLFTHGLRSNNMEAALLLAYCGGIFHYLAWTERASACGPSEGPEGSAAEPRPRARASGGGAPRALKNVGSSLNPVAVALYFTLGFMVKFVAAIFLPLVLAMAVLIVPSHRRLFVRDFRSWLIATAVAVVLIAPWFIYATVVFGWYFWGTIFGSHVYTRMTSFLDPAHVQPWNHYFLELFDNLELSDAWWLVVVGTVLLIADTIRRRRPEGLVVLLWFAVPMTIISFGTSKIYHYAYPFLPPVALAAGFAASCLWVTVRPYIERGIGSAMQWMEQDRLRWLRPLREAPLRSVVLAMAALSLVVMILTLINGSLTVHVLGMTLFKNHYLIRPGVVAAVLTILGGWPEGIARIGIPMVILAILPVTKYVETIDELHEGTLLVKSTRDCIARLEAKPELSANGPRGLFIGANGRDFEGPFNHQYSYYFRHVVPWRHPRETPPDVLRQYLFDPAIQRPVLVDQGHYRDLLRSITRANEPDPELPLLIFDPDVLIILPGPFAACRQNTRFELRQPL